MGMITTTTALDQSELETSKAEKTVIRKQDLERAGQYLFKAYKASPDYKMFSELATACGVSESAISKLFNTGAGSKELYIDVCHKLNVEVGLIFRILAGDGDEGGLTWFDKLTATEKDKVRTIYEVITYLNARSGNNPGLLDELNRLGDKHRPKDK